MNYITNKDKKEEKKNEILRLKNQLQELEDEKMNENKFWGYQIEVGDQFEYGRDVLKEGTYEDHLDLPYQSFPLFTNPGWYGNKTA